MEAQHRIVSRGDEEDNAGRLATAARRRLGPPPRLEKEPLVSIVVVNRDGAPHLHRLLTGLETRTDYEHLELILIDNDSSDGSLDLARSVGARFPISIVANPHNESFSDACNQGAEEARGELLLFLNNDVEPFEPGWLGELVACLAGERVGLAGATLIRPSEGSTCGYAVQHRAMRLRDEAGLLRADLHGLGDDPLGEGLGEDAETPIAAGACMLIERGLFQRIGGFTHGFFYGDEDVDLGLKVIEQGRSIVCSGRSLLIHHLGATRRKSSAEQQLAIRRGNRRLLGERWGPRLRREYELDRLDEGRRWAAPGEPRGAPSREEALALGFCLKASERGAAAEGEPLARLAAELRRRGHRCTTLLGDEIDDPKGLNYDVAVHLLGPARYVPKPAQLNMLWAADDSDEPPPTERSGHDSRYDLVVRSEDAGALIEAVHARAEQLAFPTRISRRPAPPAAAPAHRFREGA